MKIIKINESQKKRLFEAYREGFSFETLSILGGDAFSDWRNWDEQYNYCVKWLGEPNGCGSSRCVFTLSDNIILKLAVSDAGIEQNKLEYKTYNRYKSPLLARVYDADENFTYLVCENAVPAEDIDFEKIIGIPMGSYWQQNSRQVKKYGSKGGDCDIGFNKYFDNLRDYIEEYKGVTLYDVLSYLEEKYAINDEEDNDEEENYEEEFSDAKEIEEVIDNSEWLSMLRDFIKETKISDLCNSVNYGMVNRNGKPTLVILDYGLNNDIWEKYY